MLNFNQNMKITYNFFSHQDKEGLINLWEEVFHKKREFSESLIRWFSAEGVGYIFLAKDKESNRIVGSRGAWNWSFQYKSKLIRTIQFGLTSVSNDYRRQGIFSKLNLKYIESEKVKNIDFIYNVSLPEAKKGYEKLGWIYIDGLKRITRFNLFCGLLGKSEKYKVSNIITEEVFDIIANIRKNNKSELLTPIHDKDFLINRLSHKDNYKIYYTNNLVIIYSIKKQFRLKNIFIGEIYSDFNDIASIKRSINMIHKIENSFFINAYVTESHPLATIGKIMGFRNYKKKYLSLGIKILNDNNIRLEDIKKNIVLSYLDLDTF